MKNFLLALLILCSMVVDVNAAILVRSPNGTQTTTQPTLAAAATAATAAGSTVIVTSPLSAVQSNISSASIHAWPSDRGLKVEKGGSLGNTTSFVINGPFDAGLYQTFNGTGRVSFGAGSIKNAYPVWWYSGAGDGTTAIQAALNAKVDVIMTQPMAANGLLTIGGPSYGQALSASSPTAALTSTAAIAFKIYDESHIRNITLNGNSTNQAISYGHANGINTYDTSIEHVTINNWGLFADADYLRQSSFYNVNGYANKFIYYHGKSADVDVSQCRVAQQGTQLGSYGIYSVNPNYATDRTLEPEGLTLSGNLLYHFDNNILITDLYVGKFNNNYLDGASTTAGNYSAVFGRGADRIDFYHNWLNDRGIQFNSTGAYLGYFEHRGSLTGNQIDLINGIGIEIAANSRNLEILSNKIIGNNTVGSVGIQLTNQNDNVYMHNNKLGFVPIGTNIIGSQVANNIQIDGQYNAPSDTVVTPVVGNLLAAVIKNVQGYTPQAQTFYPVVYGTTTNIALINIDIPNQDQTLLIEVDVTTGVNITTGTGRIAKKTFTVARKNGSDVVLGAGAVPTDYDLATANAGGSSTASAVGLAIARTGVEASTATQNIKITGTFAGYGACQVKVMSMLPSVYVVTHQGY